MSEVPAPGERSYKKLFSRFLEADPQRLHFAAHSHHYWPDVSLAAQQQAWLDAAEAADDKWEGIFGETLPTAQRHIARILGLPDPRSLAFAVNTHEFVSRILSCFSATDQVRVLTTENEFHSFARQSRRWEESGRLACRRVETRPYGSFFERFREAARQETFDLIYVSQVFFDSGFVFEELEEFVAGIPPQTWVVIDGYHGFMALPTDLGTLHSRCFYTAGGYKYAMSGEGVCFLHCPPGYGAHPTNTGWFAGFGALESGIGAGDVPYATDGFRFMGATFDPTAMYRFNAVMAMLERENLTVETIHQRVRKLQRLFLECLPPGLPGLGRECLVPPWQEDRDRAHFLTFESPRAGQIHQELRGAGVMTDYRGDRLRLGFALYHDEADVRDLCARIGRVVSGPPPSPSR